MGRGLAVGRREARSCATLPPVRHGRWPRSGRHRPASDEAGGSRCTEGLAGTGRRTSSRRRSPTPTNARSPSLSVRSAWCSFRNKCCASRWSSASVRLKRVRTVWMASGSTGVRRAANSLSSAEADARWPALARRSVRPLHVGLLRVVLLRARGHKHVAAVEAGGRALPGPLRRAGDLPEPRGHGRRRGRVRPPLRRGPTFRAISFREIRSRSLSVSSERSRTTSTMRRCSPSTCWARPARS